MEEEKILWSASWARSPELSIKNDEVDSSQSGPIRFKLHGGFIKVSPKGARACFANADGALA
jgi:hypothetical protein